MVIRKQRYRRIPKVSAPESNVNLLPSFLIPKVTVPPIVTVPRNKRHFLEIPQNGNKTLLLLLQLMFI